MNESVLDETQVEENFQLHGTPESSLDDDLTHTAMGRAHDAAHRQRVI